MKEIDDQPLYVEKPRDWRYSGIAIEGECSSDYRAGWVFAEQSWLNHGHADLNADAPEHWSDEKAIGFWDRLTLEKRVRNKEGGPCSCCRKFTERRDLGSGGPYRCNSNGCIMF